MGLRSTTFPQALSLPGRAEQSTGRVGLGREEPRSGTEAELAAFRVLPQPPSSSSSWQVCPAGYLRPPGSKCEIVPTSGEVFSPLVLFLGRKEPGGVAWVSLRALLGTISRAVPSH